jgi:hypothetical protein
MHSLFTCAKWGADVHIFRKKFGVILQKKVDAIDYICSTVDEWPAKQCIECDDGAKVEDLIVWYGEMVVFYGNKGSRCGCSKVVTWIDHVPL